jgi:hypothetical protein
MLTFAVGVTIKNINDNKISMKEVTDHHVMNFPIFHSSIPEGIFSLEHNLFINRPRTKKKIGQLHLTVINQAKLRKIV